MPRPANQRDEFAQFYVAAMFADEGWTLHFPVPDRGFDFIAMKQTNCGVVIRPVQVKGKYPESVTRTNLAYGFSGKLSATHSTMVLAIPLFNSNERSESPALVAFMPWSKVAMTSKGGFRCVPAKHVEGLVKQRADYQCFFGSEGLRKFEDPGYN